MNKLSLRRWHRIVSVIIALPLFVVVLTGIVLQWRGSFESIQPSTIVSPEENRPLLSLEDISSRVQGPIDQIIYRPSKNALAVRMKDGMEVQLHPQTGVVLKSALRRTSFLIDLHQGSFLGGFGQFGLFIATSWGLLFLLVSGLLIYPWKKKVKL